MNQCFQESAFVASVFGICGFGVILAMEFIQSSRSPKTQILAQNSRAALVGIAIILVSMVPGLQDGLVGRLLTNLGSALGLSAYLKFTPRELSLWKTPAKRVITLAAIGSASVAYEFLGFEAHFLPFGFAAGLMAVHRFVALRSLVQSVGEVEAMAQKILAANSQLQILSTANNAISRATDLPRAV